MCPRAQSSDSSAICAGTEASVAFLVVYSLSCERVGRSKKSSAVVVSASGQGESSRSEAAATVTTCLLVVVIVVSEGSACMRSCWCESR
jgi:hypothetical protein